jgi:hypothetical protein
MQKFQKLVVAAGVALAALCCATPSFAQSGAYEDASGSKVNGTRPRPQAAAPNPDKPVQVAEEDRKRGMKEAPAVVARYGIPCKVTDARYVGGAKKQAGDKTVQGNAYEVACESNQGFFLTAFKDDSTAPALNCNMAETLHVTDKNVPLCALQGNRINHYWLTPLAKTKTPDCNVGKARWIGANAAGDKQMYELLCKTGVSGIYGIPEFKAADQTVSFINCLRTENTPLACTLSPRAETLKRLTPQAGEAKDGCAVSDMRYIGGKDGKNYYEVGCAPEPGFIMVLDNDDAFLSMAGCDRAEALGGCRFTDVAAVKAANQAKAEANRTAYAAALAKAAIDCSGDRFLKFGSQADTGRDVVEFKCPEQPNGLLALIPAAKPEAQFERYDCFSARMMELPCQLTTEADLLVRVKEIAKASKQINADCDVATVRYAFMSPSGVIVTELACVNKRGYIAVLDAKRTVFSPAVPCQVAATSDKVPEKCTLPGNGANTAP